MIYSYKSLIPEIHKTVFIAPSADVIGDVTIGHDSSVWFNVTIRGDVHFITIGTRTNIQDNSMLHVTNGVFPLSIGNDVTIAHSVTVHGCTINDATLIGMGAVILDGAEIGHSSIVAAGSLVREGKTFPPEVLIAGSPASVKRHLTENEIKKNLQYAENYVQYKNVYKNPALFYRTGEEIRIG